LENLKQVILERIKEKKDGGETPSKLLISLNIFMELAMFPSFIHNEETKMNSIYNLDIYMSSSEEDYVEVI